MSFIQSDLRIESICPELGLSRPGIRRKPMWNVSSGHRGRDMLPDDPIRSRDVWLVTICKGGFQFQIVENTK